MKIVPFQRVDERTHHIQNTNIGWCLVYYLEDEKARRVICRDRSWCSLSLKNMVALRTTSHHRVKGMYVNPKAHLFDSLYQAEHWRKLLDSGGKGWTSIAVYKPDGDIEHCRATEDESLCADK